MIFINLHRLNSSAVKPVKVKPVYNRFFKKSFSNENLTNVTSYTEDSKTEFFCDS